MNKGELRSRVRRQTLISANELSDGEIDTDLEQGILDLASRWRWPFLYATGTIVLADGTAEYSLPADLMFLETIKHDAEGAGTTLERVDEATIKAMYGDDLGSSDLPKFWYQTTADKISFVPVPSAVKTVDLTYYKVPDIANDFNLDADEPMFNSAFHLILVDFAMAQVWEREEQEEKAQFYLTRYFNGVERMAQFYSTRLPTAGWVVGGGRTQHRYRRKPYVNWPE